MTDFDQREGNFLGRLIKWIFTRLGTDTIVNFCLLLLLYGSLVSGLAVLIPRLTPNDLLRPVLIGLLFGWIIARSKLNTWWSWVIAFISGIFLIIVYISDAFSLLWRLVRMTGAQIPYMIVWNPSASLIDSTLVSEIQFFFNQIGVLGDRIITWMTHIVHRQVVSDSLVVMVIWSMSLWLVSFWGSWIIRRLSQPLLAVIPAGILLSVSLAYSGRAPNLFIGIIISTLLLLSWNGFRQRLKFWERHSIDYAEDLSLETNLSALGLTLALVFIAFFSSQISIAKIENFLDHFRPNLVQTQKIGESFGLTQRTPQPESQIRKAFTSIDSQGLPRQHLIGSGPELTDKLVMSVSTGDIPQILASNFDLQSLQIPRYYWKGLTFDIYNGLGWETSETRNVSYSAKESVHSTIDLFPPSGESIFVPIDYLSDKTRLVHQQVNADADLNGLFYVSGEILGVDQRYRISWRMPPDPISNLEADIFAGMGSMTSYLAWSQITQPSLEQLQTSELNIDGKNKLPRWVAERFLSLPDTIPDRVIALAEDITKDETTQFDKVTAIESYLREIPYTLDLPAPPQDRDVVDYFLFDLHTGYCDYYASAMVVLARAVGIPARLAIGYASGSYDPYQAVYIVSEADAHSWPEIYFSGIGWVEFEPTAGRQVIERPHDKEQKKASITMPTPVSSPGISKKQIGIFLTIVVCMIVFIFLLINGIVSWQLHHVSPMQSVKIIIRRLYGQGIRLGINPSQSDTPLEFSNRFINHLDDYENKKHRSGFLLKIKKGIVDLISLYNLALYSSHKLKSDDRKTALAVWKQLNWRLWFVKGHHQK